MHCGVMKAVQLVPPVAAYAVIAVCVGCSRLSYLSPWGNGCRDIGASR